jgi:restriction system protein
MSLVPAFHEFLRPFLTVLHERGSATAKEVREAIAARMQLPDDALRELLPSGRQRRFDNRVGWARTYLTKAGLIYTVTRGVYGLTADGTALVASNPAEVNLDTLRKYAAYREWEDASRVGSSGNESAPGPEVTAQEDATPEETLAKSFAVLRRSLADEIAEALQGVSWQRFEDIVVDVLLALGYGGSRGDAGHAFRASGDGGVDGVINEDRLGLSKIYVQAKRYAPDRSVGRPDVQAFVGSLLGQKARQGVLITTGRFSADAHAYVAGLSDQRVVLIDGATLAGLMMDFDVGVAEHERYILKRVDRDYFEEA